MRVNDHLQRRWILKGGVTHGATDEFGYIAVEDVVHVDDFHATMLRLFGVDHERLRYRFQSRDFRLMDEHGRVVEAILVSVCPVQSLVELIFSLSGGASFGGVAGQYNSLILTSAWDDDSLGNLRGRPERETHFRAEPQHGGRTPVGRSARNLTRDSEAS